jgi:membrane protease YdiL (CAAX protease family)
MSQNSSSKHTHLHSLHKSGAVHHFHSKPQGRSRQLWSLVTYPLFVFVAFFIATLIVRAALTLFDMIHINFGVYSTGPVFQTIVAAIIYLLAFAVVFGVPILVYKRRTTTLETLGLTRLLSWADIGLAPLAFIAYALISTLAVAIVTALIPSFPADQAQDVGFKALTNRDGYLLAFTTLVIIAPIAEETLFRGYLYGKLRARVPLWAAMIATSILFGAVHGQWNVALDTFVLSMVMCGLREITGSIWAGILLHMIKNLIAFYLLFINPIVAPTMGG